MVLCFYLSCAILWQSLIYWTSCTAHIGQKRQYFDLNAKPVSFEKMPRPRWFEAFPQTFEAVRRNSPIVGFGADIKQPKNDTKYKNRPALRDYLSYKIAGSMRKTFVSLIYIYANLWLQPFRTKQDFVWRKSSNLRLQSTKLG